MDYPPSSPLEEAANPSSSCIASLANLFDWDRLVRSNSVVSANLLSAVPPNSSTVYQGSNPSKTEDEVKEEMNGAKNVVQLQELLHLQEEAEFCDANAKVEAKSCKHGSCMRRPRGFREARRHLKRQPARKHSLFNRPHHYHHHPHYYHDQEIPGKRAVLSEAAAKILEPSKPLPTLRSLILEIGDDFNPYEMQCSHSQKAFAKRTETPLNPDMVEPVELIMAFKSLPKYGHVQDNSQSCVFPAIKPAKSSSLGAFIENSLPSREGKDDAPIREKGGLSIFYEKLRGSIREKPSKRSVEEEQKYKEKMQKWRNVSPLKLFSKRKGASDGYTVVANEMPKINIRARNILSGKKDTASHKEMKASSFMRSGIDGQGNSRCIRGETGEIVSFCQGPEGEPFTESLEDEILSRLGSKNELLDRQTAVSNHSAYDGIPAYSVPRDAEGTSTGYGEDEILSGLGSKNELLDHQTAVSNHSAYDRIPASSVPRDAEGTRNGYGEIASISEAACDGGSVQTEGISMNDPRVKTAPLRICNFSWWEEPKDHNPEACIREEVPNICNEDEEAEEKWVSSPRLLQKVFEELDAKPSISRNCDEPNQQLSPVSVLDSPFGEDSAASSTESTSSSCMESFFTSFDVAKQQLLEKVQRYEQMARLDWTMLEEYAKDEGQENDGLSGSDDDDGGHHAKGDGDSRNSCIQTQERLQSVGDTQNSLLPRSSVISHAFLDRYNRRHRQSMKALHSNGEEPPLKFSFGDILISRELRKEIRRPIFWRISDVVDCLEKETHSFLETMRDPSVKNEGVATQVEDSLFGLLLEELLEDLVITYDSSV